jgi:uncharacterized membrane protein
MANAPDSAIPLVQAAGLGVVAGMRSQLPLALLAVGAARGRFAVEAEGPLALLRSPVAQRLLVLLAVGEFVGDKLPFIPSRLEPGPLFGRMLLGALAGTAIASETRRSPALGAVLGAGGAVVGAQAGYHARVALGRATGIPDSVWGAVEDAAAVTLGMSVVHLPSSQATAER